MTCLIMTLEEMLKMALGTTTPDNVNMAILHSFLKIVLKKLDIQTDFVEIAGPDVCELRQILFQATDTRIPFKSCVADFEDDKCYTSAKVSSMEEEICRLTLVVEKMESDLRIHLDDMEKSKRSPAVGRISFKKSKSTAPDEESFSSDCEDLCDPCEQQNLIACGLLQNHDFLKKLMRRTTSPVIDRIFQFEALIGTLNEKFQNFLNTAEDEYRKIPLIEECLYKLDLLKKELAYHKEEFIATMEEIQDMLDSKLDKHHIPALKKSLTDRMSEIEKKMEAMINKEQCPKAAGVIMGNAQCLCCTTRVCQKDRIFPVPLMASVAAGGPIPEMTGKLPRLCIPRDRDRACGGDHTIIRPSEKSLRKSNLIEDFGDKMNLYVGTENVEFVRGLDGGMYRLAPDA